jgi:mitogen-activated protein kinase kinase kinase
LDNHSSYLETKQLHWVQGELIGKGSFGKVYHALNVEAGEWIAVKQVDLPIKKADFSNPQLCETRDALFREISLLEDLDNEYIVQYLGYDVDEEAGDGHINIFLEYVPGGSIASCLAKTGKFEDPLVRFFTRQILMGLAYLHNRNVLHRDIKAGNILLDQHGTCKITDFGLSKLSGQDKAYDPHSNNSVMRGTVFWMAPEVVKGTNYNAKVDIWSLGCTVIEMLTGDHPWLDLNMLAALYSVSYYILNQTFFFFFFLRFSNNFFSSSFFLLPCPSPHFLFFVFYSFVSPHGASFLFLSLYIQFSWVNTNLLLCLKAYQNRRVTFYRNASLCKL